MTAKTETVPRLGRVRESEWVSGAIGGVVGSILFGFIMQFVMPAPILEMAIPAMYGIEGPALFAGWGLHVFHGVVIGLLYVAAVQIGPLQAMARRLRGSIALGIGYGILTTAVFAVVVMPLWLSAVGFAGAPPFPNIAVPGTIVSLIGHIVYALPVTVGYALATAD